MYRRTALAGQRLFNARYEDRVDAYAHCTDGGLGGQDRSRLHDLLVCQDLADILAHQGAGWLRRIEVDALSGHCIGHGQDGGQCRMLVSALATLLPAAARDWSAGALLAAADRSLHRLDGQAWLGPGGGQRCVAVLYLDHCPAGALRSLPVFEMFGFGPYRRLSGAYLLVPNPQRDCGLQAMRLAVQAGAADLAG
ncbi:hypothetical protein P3W85_42365 [Cupriavidus basilensis]|uniref:Uncharacterized protein n=1 Tax=Cupriavidus basilensis TaxID=68895 RepID=A0ABT6B3S8_9BURK|nr:hypothetical protein [Cupriavidus basilensis]MDF3839537.1 hypothetical protein [Cupriavidus basilensis]